MLLLNHPSCQVHQNIIMTLLFVKCGFKIAHLGIDILVFLTIENTKFTIQLIKDPMQSQIVNLDNEGSLAILFIQNFEAMQPMYRFNAFMNLFYLIFFLVMGTSIIL